LRKRKEKKPEQQEGRRWAVEKAEEKACRRLPDGWLPGRREGRYRCRGGGMQNYGPVAGWLPECQIGRMQRRWHAELRRVVADGLPDGRKRGGGEGGERGRWMAWNGSEALRRCVAWVGCRRMRRAWVESEGGRCIDSVGEEERCTGEEERCTGEEERCIDWVGEEERCFDWVERRRDALTGVGEEERCAGAEERCTGEEEDRCERSGCESASVRRA
jgi:hypothetical protein